ncbi:MAG: hypothetical protein ACRDQ2_18045 [Gaiellales bacterium]
MRKPVAAIAAGAMAVAVLGAPSGAAPKQQKVEGSIALPAPFTDDSGCFAGVHRRIHAFTGDANNGILGYSFAVDKATWNKPFKLEAIGGQSYVDLDITYYLGPLTTPDDFISQGGDPATPATVSFADRAAGGEAGKVPKLAENVILGMYGGGQGAGFAADFVYTAGKGVK